MNPQLCCYYGTVVTDFSLLNDDPFVLAPKHWINQVDYVFDENSRIIQDVLHYKSLPQEFGSLNATLQLECVHSDLDPEA